MAGSRALSNDSAQRGKGQLPQRQQESSVGELMRQDAIASNAAARGRNRPPLPAGNAGYSNPGPPPPTPVGAGYHSSVNVAAAPRAAAYVAAPGARPPSGRRPADAARPGGSRESSRERIVGAFRGAMPRSQSAQRSQSRGRSPSCGPGENRSAPGSRASSAGRHGRDIIADNRDAAVAARPRALSAGRLPPKDPKFSRDGDGVPLYLQRVRAAIADEERIVSEQLGFGQPDGVPPGHRLLSEDEKRDIIAGLQKRKADLDSKHSKLPLNVVTQAQKLRASELEKALIEVEVDIGRFSKKRVLIKL